MGRTGADGGQSTPAAPGWPAMGTAAAYAAALVAFGYALMSLYWALGGHALISTIGGYVEQLARRGGALAVLVALAAALAKAAGGLLALALVRPWGRLVPRRWLLAGSAGASALLVLYGGLSVLLGALVLSGVIHPAGHVDRAALRWYVGVWDLWFLVWGILLALATAGFWRRTRTAAPRDDAADRVRELNDAADGHTYSLAARTRTAGGGPAGRRVLPAQRADRAPGQQVPAQHLAHRPDRVAGLGERPGRGLLENADPFTTTVKTTIGRLRVKLGDPPVIGTVRDGGYRI
jgi:hypothetical protein